VSTVTTNYSIVKPLTTEDYDVAIVNSNNDIIDTTLFAKVDKVSGKELSDNNYTDAEQTKLSGIETGAEVNNISDVNATDLTDSGDSTLHYHSADRYTLPTAEASVLGGVKVGSRLSIADSVLSADVQTTDISGKVDKVAGSSLVADSVMTDLTDGGNTTLHTHDSKANVAQEAWSTPTLVNSWVAVGAEPLRYRKDTLGIVNFELSISGGSSTVMTFPLGYRPDLSQYFVGSGGVAIALFLIAATGVLTVVVGSGNLRVKGRFKAA